jgi:hypothetical protein
MSPLRSCDARRWEAQKRRPRGRCGVIPFRAMRSRRPQAAHECSPSKAVVPRTHAVLLRSRDRDSGREWPDR